MAIEIIGLEPIITGFKSAPQTVERVARNKLQALGPKVVTNVRRHTPRASGKLEDAIEAEVSTVGQKDVTLRVAANDTVAKVVTASVEKGTKPHWPPWGPGSELAAWAALKGIIPFLVARAIALRGTIKRFGGPSKGAEMFEKGLRDSQPDIEDTIRETEKTLAQELI